MTHRHVLLLLIVLSAFTPACVIKGKNGVERDADLTDVFVFPMKPTTEAPAAGSRFLPAVRTKKKAGGTAFGFTRVNRRLYPPFTVSVIGGVAPGEDNAGFNGNAQVCMELDERSTINGALNFELICARREGDGLRVRAQSQFFTIGSVLFPQTDLVLMSITHDGTDLIFEARPATLGELSEGGALTEIGRIFNYSPADPDDALVPSMGASFLNHPATLVFDSFRVDDDGPPPVEGFTLTAEEQIAVDLNDVMDAVIEAFHVLNGGSPDTDAARALLVGAQPDVADAMVSVDALAKSKIQKKARGALKKTAKQLAAAIKLIDKTKPALKIIKKVGKAAQQALKATDTLDPIDP